MTKMEEIKSAYLQGYLDGMSSFAHWKDGVQYVGTCGTTLKKAIEDIDSDPKFYASLYRKQKESQEKIAP